jgi:hypothetical protein
MDGTGKSPADISKEIMNDWNYDANCMLTSLPVSDLENFKQMIFVI